MSYQDNIKKAQDRKNRGIAYFNSVNSAIEFVKFLCDYYGWKDDANENKGSDQELYKEVVKWRDKFYEDWCNFEMDNTEVEYEPEHKPWNASSLNDDKVMQEGQDEIDKKKMGI